MVFFRHWNLLEKINSTKGTNFCFSMFSVTKGPPFRIFLVPRFPKQVLNAWKFFHAFEPGAGRRLTPFPACSFFHYFHCQLLALQLSRAVSLMVRFYGACRSKNKNILMYLQFKYWRHKCEWRNILALKGNASSCQAVRKETNSMENRCFLDPSCEKYGR